jgi:hypothetical protein
MRKLTVLFFCSVQFVAVSHAGHESHGDDKSPLGKFRQTLFDVVARVHPLAESRRTQIQLEGLSELVLDDRVREKNLGCGPSLFSMTRSADEVFFCVDSWRRLSDRRERWVATCTRTLQILDISNEFPACDSLYPDETPYL